MESRHQRVELVVLRVEVTCDHQRMRTQQRLREPHEITFTLGAPARLTIAGQVQAGDHQIVEPTDDRLAARCELERGGVVGLRA